MKAKTIILTVLMFVLIAIGMVVYTHLKSKELTLFTAPILEGASPAQLI